MGELRPVTQRFIKSDIPPEIYASTVDALFEVPMALLVGSLAASVAALLTAWKAQSVVLLCFGIIIALTAVLRAIDMRAYHRVRAVTRTDPEAMKPWERRYVVGAAAYLAMLGGWSLAAFLVTDDPAVRLLSFAGTIAYLVGTSGRNFASDLLVVSQILGAGTVRRRGLLHSDIRRSTPAAPVFPAHKFEPPAPGLPRCRDRDARHHQPRHALRYRAEQHAARPLHVRRAAPAARLQRPPFRAPQPPR